MSENRTTIVLKVEGEDRAEFSLAKLGEILTELSRLRARCDLLRAQVHLERTFHSLQVRNMESNGVEERKAHMREHVYRRDVLQGVLDCTE